MQLATIVRNRIRDLPTITTSQTDDLKIQVGNRARIWSSRMTPADGARMSGEVTVEILGEDGTWNEPTKPGVARRVLLLGLVQAGHGEIADLIRETERPAR